MQLKRMALGVFGFDVVLACVSRAMRISDDALAHRPTVMKKNAQ